MNGGPAAVGNWHSAASLIHRRRRIPSPLSVVNIDRLTLTITEIVRLDAGIARASRMGEARSEKSSNLESASASDSIR